MTRVQELARFVTSTNYDRISQEANEALKIRILDSLGCAIGALSGGPMRMLREHVKDFGGNPISGLIAGGRSAPDRAALYNAGLVRYLDFNDSYLAEGETCHPSDNLGAVLAAAEYAGADGKTVLTALAAAYQVHCRLSDEAPVRAKGFDHTTQGSYAAAAGASRALGLNTEKTANALAISGTALNALRVTRTGELSHWKGLAYPHTSFGATHATFMALRGITGPPEVFEGNKGFMDSIAGPFELDWSQEDLERVRRTIIKKYNAEIHSQSATEGALELQQEHGFTAQEIEKIDIDIFDVAYHIIGGGEEGDKTIVHSKEEADHSLHYIVSVALLDGDIMPEQYRQERIERDDVQTLIRKVNVKPKEEYTARFPEEMPCTVRIELKDGTVHSIDKHDYEGFTSRPMTWGGAVDKFNRLAGPFLSDELRSEIPDTVHTLENHTAADLMNVLAQVPVPTKE